MSDKPRYVVLVWLHDHWGVTYSHDHKGTCDDVRIGAELKLGSGNALVVDTKAPVMTPIEPFREAGDPCPSCGKPILWDNAEGILYCTEDYAHG